MRAILLASATARSNLGLRASILASQGSAVSPRRVACWTDAGVRCGAHRAEEGDELFASAEAELAGLTDRSRRAKPLHSLLKHREGLCVFVDKPSVPMDNNTGERAIRGERLRNN